MRTIVFATLGILLLTGSFCFSQPANGPGKPPTMEERMKIIHEKICTPLNLDKAQTEKVDSAFKEFFDEIEKLMDKSVHPPVMPERSKVDALGKIRDEKVKLAISSELYAKYQELELKARPKGPENGGPRPK
jgi:hypothetical protein